MRIIIDGIEYPVTKSGWIHSDSVSKIIAHLLANGQSWPAIAARLGCSVESLRRWNRIGCPVSQFVKLQGVK